MINKLGLHIIRFYLLGYCLPLSAFMEGLTGCSLYGDAVKLQEEWVRDIEAAL